MVINKDISVQKNGDTDLPFQIYTGGFNYRVKRKMPWGSGKDSVDIFLSTWVNEKNKSILALFFMYNSFWGLN